MAMAKPKAKKMIKEYGGKETYSSKSAMKRHEKSEGRMVERAEKRMGKKK